MIKRKRTSSRLLLQAVMLFFFSAFALLGLKDFAWQSFALAIGVPVVMWIGSRLLPRLFPCDRMLLTLTNFLCALGVLVLYDTNPKLAWYQAIYYGIGLVLMVLFIYIIRVIRHWRVPAAVLWLASIALLALPLVFGREINGARNWIYVSGISFQPSEVVKISLVLVISFYMSRRRMLPWVSFAVICLALLMLQKDLGTALIYYGVTMLCCFCASGNLLLTGFGLLGGAGAAYAGYTMFAHVKKRVAIWRNPWSDYENAGYQIVQSLIALASGGLVGCGLGLGSPTTVPVYHTDFIFSVICEQFGLLFGLCVLAVYVAIIWRGATAAMAARSSFHALTAMSCTILIALQTFTIIGGVIKLIPLTGVTMPFVSYGGTSMLSSMCLMGILQGVCSLNRDHLEEDTRLAAEMDGGEEE